MQYGHFTQHEGKSEKNYICLFADICFFFLKHDLDNKKCKPFNSSHFWSCNQLWWSCWSNNRMQVFGTCIGHFGTGSSTHLFFFTVNEKKKKTQIHLNLCLFLAVNISGVSLKGQYKFKPLLFIIRLFIVSKSKTPPFQIFLQCEESALTLMLLIDSQASLSSLENIQTV